MELPSNYTIEQISTLVDTPCWVWQGCKNPRGYATSHWMRKTRSTHRIMYENMVGPVPKGLVLDHLCRVRHCVNPAHLEPVTSGVNTRRGHTGKHWSERSACHLGHEFTPENTRIYITKKGHKIRVCRTCQRDCRRRYRKSAD